MGLLWLAWRSLACRALFEAIVLFIAFGLLMALAWVRLDAPDIALAEAAIGAGLTGALLLSAVAGLASASPDKPPTVVPAYPWLVTAFSKGIPALATALAAVGLAYTVLSIPPETAGLNAEIAKNIHVSGVSNPVTAVLLNFRGYDTLLEMIVLLMALLGVWSLGVPPGYSHSSPGAVLGALSRLLSPMLILVAAYLLWVGAHAPGGAFQAGSILGAAGVLLLLSGWRLHPGLSQLPLRILLLVGPATFVAMAVLGLLLDRHMLEFPPQQAGLLILLLETMATLSIGATLAALFLGGRPQPDEASS